MKRSLEDDSSQSSKKIASKDGTRREATTILVRKLPKSYNQTKVRKYFENCGRITQVDVSESLDKSYRLARVQFEAHDEALTALTKTLKKVGQNEIEVSLLEKCTIWMTNFPPHYSARQIKELLQSIHVVVLSVRLPSLRYDANRRFAYADVTTPGEVATVIEKLDGTIIEGYNLVVRESNPLERTKRSDSGAVERREIMVRQLNSNQLNEEYLRQHLTGFGRIESVVIPTTQTDTASGYAFVTFDEQSAAVAAVQATEFNGEQVEIVLADRKAYIERQKVKRIMQSRTRDDRIVAMYPLSDKTSKSQIGALLLDQVVSKKEDISDILLATDKEAAIVCFKDPKLAAKCMMKLNGTEFQRKTVYCGTVGDLQRRGTAQLQKRALVCGEPRSDKPRSDKAALNPAGNGQKMTNDDFRRIFLGK